MKDNKDYITKITINDSQYFVKEKVITSDEDGVGTTIPYMSTIEIDLSVDPAALSSVIAHELTHAIIDAFGFPVDSDKKVHFDEEGMCDFMSHNAKLVVEKTEFIKNAILAYMEKKANEEDK